MVQMIAANRALPILDFRVTSSRLIFWRSGTVSATNGLILFASSHKSERISDFEKGLYEYIETKYSGLYEKIKTKKAIDDEIKAELNKAIDTFTAQFV